MNSPLQDENVAEHPGRVLALDVGRKRIGLAITDALGLTAQGLPTLERVRIREDLARLSQLAGEREVGLFLLGHPLHMSGRDSRQAGYVREFGDRLAEHTGIAVQYWDERLTSVEAGRVLRSSGIGIEKRAKAVDRLSAVLILENYLESLPAAGSPLW
jgi:putative holliday junction resolvase